MNCQYTKLKMDDRLAGCLSESEETEMDRHMSTCERCREIWAEEQQLWGVTGNFPEPPKVGADFTANVMQRVRADTKAEEAGHKIIEFPPRRRRWIPAAAALFVLLTGGYIVRFSGIEEKLQVAGHQAPAEVSDEMIIANLDILEDLELLENLEFYENLDLLESLAVN